MKLTKPCAFLVKNQAELDELLLKITQDNVCDLRQLKRRTAKDMRLAEKKARGK